MSTIEKEYKIVPLHKRPDLIPQCCTLLNSEWPRSETARRQSPWSLSRGLGSRLLRGAEEYVAKKGIKNVYLITKGQEVFYFKNGYKVCDPFKASGINDVVYSNAAFTKAKLKEKSTQCCGPPPPPMPNFQMPKFYDLGVTTHRTHMMKKL